MADPKAPVNVFAVSRENYTVISWNKVTRDVNGDPLATPVTGYIVQRSTLLNESDVVEAATVVTANAVGDIDVLYIDTKPDINLVYRIKTVVGVSPSVVVSEPSERSVASRSPSQVDEKKELVDEKLLVWGVGNWGEALWN